MQKMNPLFAISDTYVYHSPLFRASDFRPDLQLKMKSGWAYPGKGRFCLHLNRWDTFQMKHKTRSFLFFLASFLLMVLAPNTALATQGHGGIEGVYAHQIAHLFFIISMGGLIYWSRQRGLVRERGWQLIRLSAFFFILWNLDAFLVHLLDDQMEIIQVQRIGLWKIRLTDPYNSHALQRLYYFAKLDHLLCVPAIVFLYLGLRRLVKEQRLNVAKAGQP
jgi:hypothetical protein